MYSKSYLMVSTSTQSAPFPLMRTRMITVMGSRLLVDRLTSTVELESMSAIGQKSIEYSWLL
jgi:hypothetical protein